MSDPNESCDSSEGNNQHQRDPDIVTEESSTTFNEIRFELVSNYQSSDLSSRITQLGGRVHLHSTRTQAPKLADKKVLEAMQQLVTGRIDRAIFFCPESVDHFREIATRNFNPARVNGILADIETFSTNLETATQLEKLGALSSVIRDNQHHAVQFDWREILKFIDQHYPAANRNIMIFGNDGFEDGIVSLVAGLEARGAKVTPVNLTIWDDTTPNISNESKLQTMLGRIIDKAADVLYLDTDHGALALESEAFRQSKESALRNTLDENVVVIRNRREPPNSLRNPPWKADYEFSCYDSTGVVAQLIRVVPGLIQLKRKNNSSND